MIYMTKIDVFEMMNKLRALKIANNYIAFSKDGFSTNDGSCTAISPEGIFAKYLTGQIIRVDGGFL